MTGALNRHDFALPALALFERVKLPYSTHDYDFVDGVCWADDTRNCRGFFDVGL